MGASRARRSRRCFAAGAAEVKQIPTWVWIGAGLAAFYVAQKSGILKSLAASVAAAPGDIATGAVLGIGDSIGVPRTNAQRCAVARASGSTLDVVNYCPAVDAISELWRRI